MHFGQGALGLRYLTHDCNHEDAGEGATGEGQGMGAGDHGEDVGDAFRLGGWRTRSIIFGSMSTTTR